MKSTGQTLKETLEDIRAAEVAADIALMAGIRLRNMRHILMLW